MTAIRLAAETEKRAADISGLTGVPAETVMLAARETAACLPVSLLGVLKEWQWSAATACSHCGRPWPETETILPNGELGCSCAKKN